MEHRFNPDGVCVVCRKTQGEIVCGNLPCGLPDICTDAGIAEFKKPYGEIWNDPFAIKVMKEELGIK